MKKIKIFKTYPQKYDITDTRNRYVICECPVPLDYCLILPKNEYNEALKVYHFECIKCGLKGRLYLGGM